jgi:PAS domain-containing protein
MLHFGQVYLCFFIRDITRRKQAEDRLRTEHVAVQNAAAGIVIADLDALIEYANPAFFAILATPDGTQLIGTDLRSLCEPGDIVDTILSGVLGERRTWQGEVSLRRKGGEQVVVSASATCSRDEEGEPVSLVITFGPCS